MGKRVVLMNSCCSLTNLHSKLLCKLQFDADQNLEEFIASLKNYMDNFDEEDKEGDPDAYKTSPQTKMGQYQFKISKPPHFTNFILYRTCTVPFFSLRSM